MEFIDKIINSNEKKQEILLEKLKISNKPVLIYGTGVYAYVLKKYLDQKGININSAVVDKAYLRDDSFMGLEVNAIEDIISNIKEYYLIIAIANYPAVLERFKKIKKEHIIIIDVPDFLNIPKGFMDYEYVKQNLTLFEKTYDLFEDDLSRDTYIAAINTKINVDLSYIKKIVRLDNLYFPTTEFVIEQYGNILDVGGYDGDTIQDFHRLTKGEYEKIISLEPFSSSYKKLNDNMNKLGISSKVQSLQIGAWFEKAKLSFKKTDKDIDNKISILGDCSIEVDTIDSIINRVDVSSLSLIKMDINGAEYNAVRGARKVIQKFRPQIALKIHVKEDFYRIPILLKEIMPDIKLYLRQRNYMSMMLMLYGVFK